MFRALGAGMFSIGMLLGSTAMAVCHGRTEARASRRYACGIIALRPDRDGRIAGYEGTEGVFRQYGENVVGSHFPEPGTPTQPVEAGYMANAWMRVRHPDYDELRAILNDIGERYMSTGLWEQSR